MSRVLTKTTTHQKDIKVMVHWHDVERLLQQEAMAVAGYDMVDPPKLEFKVEFKQQTQGSPSYSIGEWYAYVSITEKLTVSDQEEGD